MRCTPAGHGVRTHSNLCSQNSPAAGVVHPLAVFFTVFVVVYVPIVRFVVRGLGCRGPHTQLPPNLPCTLLLWSFLRVVGIWEGGPMSLLRAVLDWVPWAENHGDFGFESHTTQT